MRIYLEDVSLARERELLEGVRKSRSFHRPWMAPPSTPERFRSFVKAAHSNTRRTFFVLDAKRQLVGVITVSEIVRGFFQSAYLSYFALAPHHGSGQMSAGLCAVLKLAFGELRLHRVEANIQPSNTRSIALVRRAGFTLEGYSKRYLKIGGRWRDHERWALTKEAFRPKRSKR